MRACVIFAIINTVNLVQNGNNEKTELENVIQVENGQVLKWNQVKFPTLWQNTVSYS